MTKLAIFLIGGGLAAWFFLGEQARTMETPPASVDPIEALRYYPGARMQLGSWLGAGAAVLGLIVLVMPKGRSF